MKTLLMVVSTLFIAACSSTSVQQKSAMINSGDSKADVVKIMGPPENRQMRGKQEAWQYCQNEFGAYNFAIVWLNDDKVQGVNTYRKSGEAFTSCTSTFNTIRWEDAPTMVVEHRER